MKQLGLSFISYDNIQWYNNLENNLAIFYKIECSLTYDLNSYTHWYLCKWVENMVTQKCALSSLVINAGTRSNEDNFISEDINDKLFAQLYNRILLMINKWAMYLCNNVDETWTLIAKSNKPTWKEYILYDSIYMTS